MMTRNQKFFFGFILAAMINLGSVSMLRANEESQGLILKGAVDLGLSKFSQALGLFQQALKADPKDADAHFLIGLTLNRLGRHKKALESLSEAEILKTLYRDLHFELGWAYLFTLQNEHAFEALSHYETIKPGRGLTKELLGRAYLALNQIEKAQTAFEEAIRRDRRLTSSCKYFLAAITLRQGKRDDAVKMLQEVVQSGPRTATGKAAANLLDSAQTKTKRWDIMVYAGGGYDSNVIGLDDSQPLPTGFDKRYAGFTKLSLAADYDLVHTTVNTVKAGYKFESSFFDGISSFDRRTHNLRLLHYHSFNDHLWTHLGIDDRYSEIGGDPLSNDVTLSPSLGVRLTDWAVLRFPYSVTLSDNFLSVAPVLDRDGQAQQIGSSLVLRHPATGMSARIGYDHTWNMTDGSDYDFDSNSMRVGFNLPLPLRTTLDISYMRIFERYDNLNSFTSFAARRKDDVDIIGVELNKTLTKNWSIQTRYNYVNDDSNIETFQYDRHVWTAGVSYRY